MTEKSSFESYRVFGKIEKAENGHFFVIFGLILAIVLISQSLDFAAIVHTGAPTYGCRKTVSSFMKTEWIVFEKFEIFTERLEGKKRHGVAKN